MTKIFSHNQRQEKNASTLKVNRENNIYNTLLKQRKYHPLYPTYILYIFITKGKFNLNIQY